MIHARICAAVLVAAVMVTGCSSDDSPPPPTTPEVYTTFYPTTWFAQRIAGALAKVVCPLPADEDAIFWMPDAKVIQAYQNADLIVINGAHFEKWVAKVSLPPSKLVDTAAPMADAFVRFKDAVTHKHGKGGQHSHEGIDGHTWVDPCNAKTQAAEIHAALAKLLPGSAKQLDANYTALAADLDALDAALGSLSRKLGDRSLLASHPAYNYLAKRYGWNITNLDLDPQLVPSDDQIARIRRRLAGIAPAPKIILWEQHPIAQAAERLKKEFDLVSIEFSPCEQPPEPPGDYLSVMRGNIERLQAALGSK